MQNICILDILYSESLIRNGEINIKTIRTLLLYCITITVATQLKAGEMRAWVSKSRDTVEAELIKTIRQHIILQTSDGKQMKTAKKIHISLKE